MVETILWTSAERILRDFQTFLLFLTDFLYYLSARKKDNKNERTMLYGFSFLAFFAGLGNIFFILSHYYAPGSYVDGIYLSDLTITTSLSVLFANIGYALFLGGYFIQIFLFESAFKRSKYLVSIVAGTAYIITFITRWFLPFNSDLWYAGASILIFLSFLTIFILLRTSNIEYQNLALFLLTGFSIISIYILFDQPATKSLGIISLETNSVIAIIGIVFLIIPTIVDVNKFAQTNPKLFLYSYLVVNTIVLVINTYCVIYFGYGLLISSFLLVMVNLSAISIYKKNKESLEDNQNLKSEKSGTQISKLNLLTAFSKPESLTEEEVSISKEKKICIVCKGKINGLTFVCSDCGTFYCVKCYNSLVDLENCCWACDSILDGSKPAKHLEKVEKDINITGKK